MNLFKFRSLQNLEFFIDIIINERLHCAYYSELNDPFEGLFYQIFKPTGKLLGPLAAIGVEFNKCKSVDDIDEKNKHSRICSLSKSLNDIRLWSHYGDGHKGVAIEIDFSENSKDLNKSKVNPGSDQANCPLSRNNHPQNASFRPLYCSF